MGKKRANGEGSISKRADRRYVARYTVNHKQKSIYGHTYEEVRQKLNEKLYEIASETYIEPSKDTVGGWLRDWLTTYAFISVKQSTYISYEAYIRLHLEPELGHIKLTSLTAEHAQRIFNKKYKGSNGAPGLSPKTLRNIYNMFNAAIEQAITNGKLIRNPLKGVRLPKVTKKEMRILTPDEQLALHIAAENANVLAAFGIIFTLSTGVRLGELLGFQWSDLTQSNHTIRVRRTVNRLQKVDQDGNLLSKSKSVHTTELTISTPKTAASCREIPLFRELWDSLMEYKEKQIDVFDDMDIPFDEHVFIFCSPSGKIYDPRVYEDLFKKVLHNASLEGITFHALRHTFATRALEAGIDVKVLSTILGHTQASTTLNLYAHALSEHKRSSMEKMSIFFGQRTRRSSGASSLHVESPRDQPSETI